MTGDLGLDSSVEAELTRRQALRRLGLGGLTLAAPAALAACGGGSSSTQGASAPTATTNKQLDNITWLTLEENTLNVPAVCCDAASISRMMTEPILKFDKDLNVVGHLAESWQAVDPVTYVYKVRQGVKYWDGTLMTAEDVAYAMQRHKDPKTLSQIAGIIPPLKSIEATGPDEVTVTLKEPNATWAYLPTYMQVAPKAFYEKLGKDFGSPNDADSVLGTGPYKPVKFRSSERFDLIANDAYWGPKPPARKFSAKVVRDDETRLLAMQAGEGDGTFDITASALDRWKKLPNVVVTAKPTPNYEFFAFDIEAKPWDDIHIRRGIAHCFDGPGLVNALYRGYASVAESIVPRPAWGNKLPKDQLDELYNSLPKYPFDLDKARAEFAQSKYAGNLTGDVWYYHNDTTEKICLSLQENLKKVGFTLNLKPPTDEVGVAREDDHKDLGFGYHGWGASIDLIDMPNQVLLSTAAVPLQYNEANYKNPEVDELIKKNLASIDENERNQIVMQLMKIAARDLPYLPTFCTYQAVATSKRLVYKDFNSNYSNQMWIEQVSVAA